VSKQDTHFFNVFSVVIALLVAFAIAVFAFARYVGAHEQMPQMLEDPMLVKTIGQRTALPARVAIAGQDNSAMKIEAAPAGGGAGAALPIPTDGPGVFEAACKACHATGLVGSPKVGDKADWGPRIAQGKATLYEHAVKGFTGKKGVMPPKGGRLDFSDELVHMGVDYLVSQAQ
jgi:cytochrome c5